MEETSYKRRLAHNGETLTATIKQYLIVIVLLNVNEGNTVGSFTDSRNNSKRKKLYTLFLFFPVRSYPVTTDPKGEAFVGSILLLD